MPTDTAEVQKQQGPDGKWYNFPKTWKQDRIDKHFTKQGWIKKDNEWYTQSGEKASTLSKVPSSTPGFTAKRSITGLTGLTSGAGRFGVGLVNKENRSESNLKTGLGSSLGSIGGGIGGMFGGTLGAAGGGGTGEAVRQLLVRPTFMEPNPTTRQVIGDVMKEAILQAGLEKGGQLAGQTVFKVLNKIPHAKIIEKIPFLPHEWKEGGKLSSYVSDLLTNLFTSSKTMEEFRAGQTKAVEAKLGELVNGMSHFKGTSAEIGQLLQNAVKIADKDAQKSLMSMAKAKGFTKIEQLYATPEWKAYEEQFRNTLMKKIASTESPSLIAGYVRNATIGSEENLGHLVETLAEKNPRLLGKARATIMRDFVTETLKGSTDPVAKGAIGNKFSGQKFQQLVSEFGEERLKTFLGEKAYDSVEEFINLTHGIGNNTASGAGRWMNLALLLPFRNGISLKSGEKLGAMALITNRMAKVLTSTEGMKAYKGMIEATGKQLPRLANLYREEIKAFNEKADKEYELEKEEDDAQYEEIKKEREKARQKK